MKIPEEILNDPRFEKVASYIEGLIALNDKFEAGTNMDAIHVLCYVTGYLLGHTGNEMPVYIEALTAGLNLSGHEAKVVRYDLPDSTPKAQA